jgi:hypothetical protein
MGSNSGWSRNGHQVLLAKRKHHFINLVSPPLRVLAPRLACLGQSCRGRYALFDPFGQPQQKYQSQ